MRRRYIWTSGAGGVVTCSPVGIDSSPITALTVLIMPTLIPAAWRILKIRFVVVVLPSVPVTPITVSRREGKP
jgi:hypothetical protein